MLKTPPKMAMLGIALTILAIGTGHALDANEVAEVPESLMEEFQPLFNDDFQPDLHGVDVDFGIVAPVRTKLQRVC